MQKVEIHKAETGGFVLITSEKCLQIPTIETVVSEIRSAFRQDNSEQKQPEPCSCPYCSSTNTIGHGLRETGKQVLTRRFCKSCNKTWVSGREQRIAASTKEQVAFLKFLDYSEKDISELVHKSKSTGRAHIENIGIAKYREKKAEAEQTQSAKVTVQANTIPSILAPEFDRAQVLRERIGIFKLWRHNGSIAAIEKGNTEVVYLAKDSILHMKTLRNGAEGRQKLSEYISPLPEAQRETVSKLIETLIDDDMGMFPMLKVGTTVGDAEIDAEDYENGRFGGE